jgi:hypothetical protein
MIEPNIWGAFRGTGVKHLVVDAVQRVSFDEMTLRETEGFKELWDINFSAGNLSPRCHSYKTRGIKEPEYNGMDLSSSKFRDGAGTDSG